MMQPPLIPLPERRCPLCGGPNGCAPAESGTFATPCWCRTVKISSEVLARVPAEQRGRACICARCAGAEVTDQTDPAGQAAIGTLADTADTRDGAGATGA